MASLNEDSSQKDILNDGINNILAVNATMMDLTQTSEDSTNNKYTKTDNEDERITLIILYRLVVSSLFPPFSSLYKHRTELYAI